MSKPDFEPPFGYDLTPETPNNQSAYAEAHGRNKIGEKASNAELKLKAAILKLRVQDTEGTETFFGNQITPNVSLVFSTDTFTYRLTRVQLGFEFTRHSWDFQRAYILEKYQPIQDGNIPEDTVPDEISAVKVSHSDPHIYAYRDGKLLTDSKPAWSGIDGMIGEMAGKPKYPWIAK